MLIVSHSRRYLEEVCNRFLLFRDGMVEEFDSFRQVYHQYKLMMMTDH